MTRTGQCLCGAVKLSVTDPNPKLGACHCKMCQRWSGSAFMTATVKPGTMEIEGEDNITRFKSSDWAERAFCGTCGAGLFYEVTAPGKHHGMRFVAAGLFDDTEGMRLENEIYYDKRSGVFSYDGDTKKMTEAEVMAQFAGG